MSAARSEQVQGQALAQGATENHIATATLHRLETSMSEYVCPNIPVIHAHGSVSLDIPVWA